MPDISTQLENALQYSQHCPKSPMTIADLESLLKIIKNSPIPKNQISFTIVNKDGEYCVILKRGRGFNRKGRNITIEDDVMFQQASDVITESKNQAIAQAIDSFAETTGQKFCELDFTDPKNASKIASLIGNYKRLIRLSQKAGLISEVQANELIEKTLNGDKESLLEGIGIIRAALHTIQIKLAQTRIYTTSFLTSNFCKRLGFTVNPQQEEKRAQRLPPPPRPAIFTFTEKSNFPDTRSPQSNEKEQQNTIIAEYHQHSIDHNVSEVLELLGAKKKAQLDKEQTQDEASRERDIAVSKIATAMQAVPGASSSDLQLTFNKELVHKIAHMSQDAINELIEQKVAEHSHRKREETIS